MEFRWGCAVLGFLGAHILRWEFGYSARFSVGRFLSEI